MNDPVVRTGGGGTRSRSPAASLLLAAIRSYQVTFASLLGGQCRFVPSCSAYAAEAIARHGALRGSWLAAWRLLRCQPLCRGGLDLVPAPRDPRGETP